MCHYIQITDMYFSLIVLMKKNHGMLLIASKVYQNSTMFRGHKINNE